jgi:carboxylate-amine ligase
VNTPPPLHLFEALGIELEYMIVDGDTLDVLPIADELLRAAALSPPLNKGGPGGVEVEEYPSEVETGPLCWSNELVLHVIELKANGPAPSLEPLPTAFQGDVARINTWLAAHGGRLMPSAMHPWMDPTRDTKLWPHDYGEVYRAFDKVFGCRGHGWSNLQSVHINLPFADDAEFGRLHAAIRLVLPIIPALAASSPIVDGRLTGLLDNRLAFYRTNCARVPSVTGRVIPEPVFTQRDYEEQILGQIYRDIAPYEPQKTLRDEWVNARGAIARFCRNTIEIRVIDTQECPAADVAIAAAIVAVLKAMVAERWIDLPRQQAWAVEPLDSILQAATKDAESAIISDGAYMEAFGFRRAERCTAGELWHHLVETLGSTPPLNKGGLGGGEGAASPLRTILEKGTLARRIINTLGKDASSSHTAAVYRDLCECLAQGRMLL